MKLSEKKLREIICKSRFCFALLVVAATEIITEESRSLPLIKRRKLCVLLILTRSSVALN
jgi:hypothetical protein